MSQLPSAEFFCLTCSWEGLKQIQEVICDRVHQEIRSKKEAHSRAAALDESGKPLAITPNARGRLPTRFALERTLALAFPP